MGVPSSQVSWSLQTLKAADAQYGVSRDRSTLSEKHQDAAAPSRPVQVFNPATSEAYHMDTVMIMCRIHGLENFLVNICPIVEDITLRSAVIRLP
jgi:hypothetical protein